MGNLIYIDKVKSNPDAFGAKVLQIASDLYPSNPVAFANWLMVIMNFESGLNPQAQNKSYPVNNGYATGLIQFVPSTAGGLLFSDYNVNTDRANGFKRGIEATNLLYKMNNIQQLDYVKKYLTPYRNKIKDFADTYLTVFYPAFIGKPDSTLWPANVVSSNPFLSREKITNLGQYKEWLLTKLLPANLQQTNPGVWEFFAREKKK